MLIVRATKKLAQRLGGFDPVPTEPDLPLLGEWYATVIFWRPQVALFVSETTLLPVFVPLAPASSVIRRMPTELADLLRRQEVPGAFIDNELSKMNEAVCVPTASPSTLGVLNEYVFLAGHAHVERGGPSDLAWLDDWLAQTPIGPLHKRHGSPDRELAALVAGSV